RVDADLHASDVRLTQGGEPTFVSVDDPDGAEWNYTAMSPAKRRLAEALLLHDESALPDNVDPLGVDLAQPGERARSARLLRAGIVKPAGFVLPLKAVVDDAADVAWETSPWPLRRERLYAIAGDSPLGLRLPLGSLPDVLPAEVEHDPDVDPFAAPAALARRIDMRSRAGRARSAAPREVIKTALAVEVREGHLHVFAPPVKQVGAYAQLIASIEATARVTRTPVVVEGY